jgi:hypothetical protein
MPYKDPKDRDFKREYDLQVKRGAIADKIERQRARRAIDKTGKDTNGNGKADKREGKDVAHRKAMDKGGTNKDGVFIENRAKNRSFKRDAKGNLVHETSKRERKK